MDAVTICDRETGSSARVAPELGFNCFEFLANVDGATVSVIDAADSFLDGNERPSGHGIPLLFPFPNRIREGRFTWNDREYHLPESKVAYDRTGNAIHGFCLDRPWRVVDSGESFVTGQFQLSKDAADRLELWPADFRITVRYEIKGATLECRVRIENPGEQLLPWGFGTHPYFRLPLSAGSEPQHCLVQVPASREWVLHNCLPSGEQNDVPAEKDFRDGAYYGITHLDDVLTGLEGPSGAAFFETVIMDENAGLQIAQRFSRDFREAVVFTPPDRDAVCIEPYTCVTDAVNLQQQGIDAGWQTLDPGGRLDLAIDIEAGPIVV